MPCSQLAWLWVQCIRTHQRVYVQPPLDPTMDVGQIPSPPPRQLLPTTLLIGPNTITYTLQRRHLANTTQCPYVPTSQPVSTSGPQRLTPTLLLPPMVRTLRRGGWNERGIRCMNCGRIIEISLISSVNSLHKCHFLSTCTVAIVVHSRFLW